MRLSVSVMGPWRNSMRPFSSNPTNTPASGCSISLPKLSQRGRHLMWICTRIVCFRDKGNFNTDDEPVGDILRVAHICGVAHSAASSPVDLDSIGPLKMYRYLWRCQCTEAFD